MKVKTFTPLTAFLIGSLTMAGFYGLILLSVLYDLYTPVVATATVVELTVLSLYVWVNVKWFKTCVKETLHYVIAGTVITFVMVPAGVIIWCAINLWNAPKWLGLIYMFMLILVYVVDFVKMRNSFTENEKES